MTDPREEAKWSLFLFGDECILSEREIITEFYAYMDRAYSQQTGENLTEQELVNIIVELGNGTKL